MLYYYFSSENIKIKRHINCLLIGDNQTPVDTGTVEEPSIYEWSPVSKFDYETCAVKKTFMQLM